MTGDHQVGRPVGILRGIDEYHGADGDDEKARDDQERHHGPENFQFLGPENCRGSAVVTPRERNRTRLQDHAYGDHQKNDGRDHQNQ